MEGLFPQVKFGTLRTRRVTRGDFGQFKTEGSYYPGLGLSRSLGTLAEKLEQNHHCNPGGASPDDLTEEVRQKLQDLDIPDDQKCLASALIESQNLIKRQQQTDSRMIQVPKGPLGFDSGNERYDDLNRTEKAKKHLDTARHLNWFAVALLRKSITLRANAMREASDVSRRRLIEESQMNLRKANALIGVDGKTTGKRHRAKTSALWELWRAYVLVRDYEQNPLAPLHQVAGRWLPNLKRLDEDRAYVLMMGTARMQPNGLGLDSRARRVWYERGIPDPNWVPPTAGDYGPDMLFENVPESFVGGPMWAQAVWDVLDLNRQQPLPNENLPILTRVDLERQNVQVREAHPDFALALADVHRNAQNVLDGDVVASAFFPSGQSQSASGRGPPFLKVDPTPLFGVPSTQSGFWDGRHSLNFLKSKEGRLAQEVLGDKEVSTTRNETIWEDGPLVPTGESYMSF